MSLRVEDWGFTRDAAGAMVVGGVRVEEAARRFGTPLHLLDVGALRRSALRYRAAFEAAYPGRVHAYFALKANNTPGVVDLVRREGLRLEVGTSYEWTLARRLGADPVEILVNGPMKGDWIERALAEDVGLVVADGPADLDAIEGAARRAGRRARVLLRVNPDAVPRGMNRATATGSRRHSVFGFDFRTGEVETALARVAASAHLRYAGLHCHVGTGVRRVEDYRRPLRVLLACAERAFRRGLATAFVDVGGGFGVPTSREFDTPEFLLYQALGRLPRPPRPDRFPRAEAFAAEIATLLADGCDARGLERPTLLLEPGRAIASSAGVLLVTVGAIKKRPGVAAWAVTDGGAGTVAFPLYYEYHEIFLARAADAARGERYTIVGPACFSADWICRNKPMPPLRAGDVLAVCDAGAYFTVQESNFGFARPAIVAVQGGAARVLRRRERFDDMVRRDRGWGCGHAA